MDLEIALKKKFKLKDVRVVAFEDSDLHSSLGKAAAVYVQRILTNKMKVGISWGKTLRMVVEHLREDKNINDLEVVTLIGGSGGMDSQIHANILCEKFLSNFHGKGYFLYAPTIVDSKSLLDLLMSNTETGNILERAKRVDLALVGIGSPIDTSTVLETGYFDEQVKAELKREGAVGDICSRFFDENGNICDLSINDRIFGIALEDLKNIENVIGVAGGEEKIKSILGALRGKFINILITDEVCAKGILKLTS
jgi:deoxyribonucleoside regulator